MFYEVELRCFHQAVTINFEPQANTKPFFVAPFIQNVSTHTGAQFENMSFSRGSKSEFSSFVLFISVFFLGFPPVIFIPSLLSSVLTEHLEPFAVSFSLWLSS